MEPTADPQRSTSIGRKIATVAAVLLALTTSTVAVAAVVDRNQPSTGTFCTLAGFVGPTFDTPEEAFGDWWRHADHSALPVDTSPPGTRHTTSPTAADFVRDGHNYRWYTSDDHWLQVDIDHPRSAGHQTSDGWTIVGINRCGRTTVTS